MPSDITKIPSLADIQAAMIQIGGERGTAVPDADDLYESSSEGKNYTPYRMPKDTRSALVANKVEPSRGPIVTWCKPGNYKEGEKIYHMVGGSLQELFPTDIIGTLIDCEIRPSRRGNEGEPATSSVIGVCRDGQCIRRLPSIATGIVGGIYEYSESADYRNTQPSKELASLKWKPVTPEGLLEDLIREGRSTATVTDNKGEKKVVGFENRGMAYMWVTHVGVRILLGTDNKTGEPIIKKTMDREEVLANLITTERRTDKKVFKSYSYLRLYHLSELVDEDGEALAPMFIALNMSNSAMKSHYNGGLAGINKYLMALLNSKGLKAPVGRVMSEDDSNMVKTINEMGFYKRASAWTTIMSLGMKEVQSGTFYSAPHFEGFDIFGSSLYEGKQHETWGDSKGISSLNVTYLSDSLRERLRYDPSTSKQLGVWEKALEESGFDVVPEEFTLASLVGRDLSSTPRAVDSARPQKYVDVPVSATSYFVDSDDNLEEDIYA